MCNIFLAHAGQRTSEAVPADMLQVSSPKLVGMAYLASAAARCALCGASREACEIKKTYAGSENHSPRWIKEEKATLVPSTVILLYQNGKRVLREKQFF